MLLSLVELTAVVTSLADAERGTNDGAGRPRVVDGGTGLESLWMSSSSPSSTTSSELNGSMESSVVYTPRDTDCSEFSLSLWLWLRRPRPHRGRRYLVRTGSMTTTTTTRDG
jgi:hypothetical protein